MNDFGSSKGLVVITADIAPFIDSQLWSIKRLAEYLDVPVPTIRYWCYKRQIPFVKVGRHVRFKPSDVLKWLSEKSCESR